MRVLCLSMIPNGGAVAHALEILGYKPYSFASLLTSYHMTSDLQHWAALLAEPHAGSSLTINNYNYQNTTNTSSSSSNCKRSRESEKKSFDKYKGAYMSKGNDNKDKCNNKNVYVNNDTLCNDSSIDRMNAVYNPDLFAAYDVLAGPPAAMRYDVILPQCPSFTKVILVVEPNKEQWAHKLEECMAEVDRTFRKRTKLNTPLRHLQTIITNMFVKSQQMRQVETTSEHANIDVREADHTNDNVINNNTPSAHNLIEENLYEEREMCTKTKMNMSSNNVLEAALASSTHQPTSSSLSLQQKQKITDTQRANAERRTEKGKFDELKSESVSNENTKLFHPLAKALQLYEESVEMAIPPSKLLVFHYKDEWSSLCAFLDKPVPDKSFPPYDDGLRVLRKLSDRLNFNHLIWRMCKWGFALYLLYLLYPQFNVWRQYFIEMYEDYKIAHDWDDHSNSATTTVNVTNKYTR